MRYIIKKRDSRNNLYSYSNEIYNNLLLAEFGILNFIQRDMLFLSMSKDKKIYIVEYEATEDTDKAKNLPKEACLVNKVRNEKEYEEFIRKLDLNDIDKSEQDYVTKAKEIEYSEIIYRYIIEEVDDDFKLPDSNKEKLSFVTFVSDLNNTLHVETNIGNEKSDDTELTVKFCQYCVKMAQNIKLTSSQEIILKYDEKIPNRAYLVQGNIAVCTMIIYSSQAHEIIL